ncbi:MAG: hypothetical protein JWM11_1286 [Planctomycetaceae bacterium]|nr:hypothetical protein [Planctomycetaceae bacterium]
MAISSELESPCKTTFGVTFPESTDLNSIAESHNRINSRIPLKSENDSLTELTSMTLTDYADWCLHAGIYTARRNPGDRYRTYREKLSTAGANSLIVESFLDKNEKKIDLVQWRRSEMYSGDIEPMLALTSEALRAVGAPRLADVAAVIEWQSPPSAEILAKMETRDEVVGLLEKYVTKHQDELAADVTKFGDVRKRPAFDSDKNLQELQDRQRRIFILARQGQRINEHAEKLKLLKQSLEQGAVSKSGLKQWKEIRGVYEEYNKSKADDLTPEMAQWRDEFRSIQARYSTILSPPPFKDKDLMIQLTALGTYQSEVEHNDLTIEVDDVKGLECPWGRLSLSFRMPKKKPDEPFKILLTTAHSFITTWKLQFDLIKQEILEQFDNYRSEMDVEELAEYLDDSGVIPEATILANIEGGCLNLSLDEWPGETEPTAEIFCGAAWDSEHGFHMHLDLPEMTAPKPPPVAKKSKPDGKTKPAASDASPKPKRGKT